MKYTLERQEEFLREINHKFVSHFETVHNVTTGFFEEPDGTRHSIQTFVIKIAPEELVHCENKVNDVLSTYKDCKVLALRKPWEISEPTKGYFTFLARFRVLDGLDIRYEHKREGFSMEKENKYGDCIK